MFSLILTHATENEGGIALPPTNRPVKRRDRLQALMRPPVNRKCRKTANVGEGCVVKSVTILAKMLDKVLNLNDRLPGMNKS